jgi:DNA-binding FadR family transcriptional regulator
VFYETVSSLVDKTIIMRAAAMQTKTGREMSIKDHIEIMAAIEKRNLKELKDLIHEHLKFAPKHYESIRPFLFV